MIFFNKLKLLSILFFVLGTPLSAGTLILLIDYSQSVSDEHKKLQLDSYRLALSDEYIIAALGDTKLEVIIFSDGHHTIASGNIQEVNKQLIPELNPKIYSMTTCIADVLSDIIIRLPELEEPVVIDISGDGPDNCSHVDDVDKVVNVLNNKGVTINTLPIATDVDYDVISWYKMHLQTSNGFTIPVKEFNTFNESLYEKLLSEISMINIIDSNRVLN